MTACRRLAGGDRPAPAAGVRAWRALYLFWRALIWGVGIVYFSFVVLVLALRYVVLPHIEDYRVDIEQLASRTLGQGISIGRIEASWYGINLDLTFVDVRVADQEGRLARWLIVSRPSSPGGRCRAARRCACCASTNRR